MSTSLNSCCLFLLSFMLSWVACPTKGSAAQNDSLEYFVNRDLNFFETQKIQSSFIGEKNIPIVTFKFIHNVPVRKALFLQGGRGSSIILYASLVRELYDAGFDIYALDHRGFGFSGRLTDNPQVTYVDDYGSYVDDLNKFYLSINPRSRYADVGMVTGSMGAVVAALYSERFPDAFDAMVFAAPMFGIKTPYLLAMLRNLSAVMTKLGKGQKYMPSQDNYHPDDGFCENFLTHSKERCVIRRHLYKKYPDIVSGGVSYAWFLKSIVAVENVMESPLRFRPRLLILQAADDDRVPPQPQTQFCQRSLDCTLVSLKNARHDIFNEAPSIREQALKRMFEFLEK